MVENICVKISWNPSTVSGDIAWMNFICKKSMSVPYDLDLWHHDLLNLISSFMSCTVCLCTIWLKSVNELYIQEIKICPMWPCVDLLPMCTIWLKSVAWFRRYSLNKLYIQVIKVGPMWPWPLTHDLNKLCYRWTNRQRDRQTDGQMDNWKI